MYLELTMKPCTIGQELQSSSGVCIECTAGFFSLTSNEACIKCIRPEMEDCPGGSTILIAEGYWRRNASTILISECYNYQSNCLGGYSDFTCVTGNIGALCEECDLYGERAVQHSN